jgi:hypothetical protein
MMVILCICVRTWTKGSCQNYYRDRRKGIKENDGGANLMKICCKCFCKCQYVLLV